MAKSYDYWLERARSAVRVESASGDDQGPTREQPTISAGKPLRFRDMIKDAVFKKTPQQPRAYDLPSGRKYISGLQDQPQVIQPRYDELINATAAGIARADSATATLLQGIIDPVNVRPLALHSTDESAQKAIDALKADADLMWQVSKHPELAAQNTDIASRALRMIGETLPYMTATTAASTLGGPLGGMGVGTLIEGNSAYRTALDNGVPEATAKAIGVGVGIVSGAIEAYGGKHAEKLITQVTKKLNDQAMTKGFKTFTIGALTEALEEGSQEVAQIVGEEIYRDVDWNERVQRVVGSAAAGASMGLFTKGGGHVLRTGITKQSQAAQRKRVAQKLSNVVDEVDIINQITNPVLRLEKLRDFAQRYPYTSSYLGVTIPDLDAEQYLGTEPKRVGPIDDTAESTEPTETTALAKRETGIREPAGWRKSVKGAPYQGSEYGDTVLITPGSPQLPAGEPASIYRTQLAADLGLGKNLADAQLALEMDRNLQSMRDAYNKHLYRKDVKLSRRKGNPGAFNPWSSALTAFMNFESRTLIPVTHLFERISRNAGAMTNRAVSIMNQIASPSEAFAITPEENDAMGEWLFSADPEVKIAAEGVMSPRAMEMAKKCHEVLQGVGANEVCEMSMRIWADGGRKPSNVKEFVGKEWSLNPDEDSLLASFIRARAEGKQKEWVAAINSGDVKLGARQIYYMSEAGQWKMIDDFVDSLSQKVLEKTVREADEPSTYAREAGPRKGKKVIPKQGSVIKNIENHLTKLMTMNAVADDMRTVYSRIKAANDPQYDSDIVSEDDIYHVSEIFKTVLGKMEPLRGVWKLGAKVKRGFWRVRLSSLFDPISAGWMSFRNALQDVAHGPTVFNATELTKMHFKLMSEIGKDVTVPRLGALKEGLQKIDPEMTKRMEIEFENFTGQRRQVFREFLLMNAGDIASNIGTPNAIRRMMYWGEKTSGLYGRVDSMNRVAIWIPQYQIVKDAANEYMNSKRTAKDLNRFYRRTKLDTQHKVRKHMVLNLLDQGMVDELAMRSASWAAFDTNFGYATHLRGAVEQRIPGRLALGVITWPRGALELVVERGVRPMIEGSKSGNWRQSVHGAKNLISYLLGSSIAGLFLKDVAGKAAYGLMGLLYSPGDPGAMSLIEVSDKFREVVYRWQNGEIGMSKAVNGLIGSFQSAPEVFVPFVNSAIEVSESLNNTSEVNLYKLLKAEYIKRRYGTEAMKDAAVLKRVERDGYEKFIHLSIGGFEKPRVDKEQLRKEEAARKVNAILGE